MSHAPLLRPALPPGTHPIETGRYTLSTPPLSRFCDDLKGWIKNRATGAMVTGQPRTGKTRGIRFAVEEIRDELGPTFPIMTFSCEDHQRPTEARFFEFLLSEFGHSLSHRGTTGAKRARLIQLLIQEACAHHHNRLIIIADEAQRLNTPQYNWLVDIYNAMDRQDIATTFVLVGQPELANQRDVFEESKKMQIIGRFMVHLHEFTGLRNFEDFTYCLKGYDEESEYPEGSGCSFTKYFFPSGFQAGWRLASQAKVLWKAFQEVRDEAKLPGKAEIPMQYFSRTVEFALNDYGSLEGGKPIISLNQWKEAIEHSGYRDGGRYL